MLLIMAATVFGALLQELMHWWALSKRLDSPACRRILSSKRYWAMILIYALGSAFFSYVWFYGESPKPKDAMLLGAALPLLVKKFATAIRDSNSENDGGNGGGGRGRSLGEDVLDDYLA